MTGFTNCFIRGRRGQQTVLSMRESGDYFIDMDRYAIVPLEDFIDAERLPRIIAWYLKRKTRHAQ